jgi:SsrA-binding protein
VLIPTKIYINKRGLIKVTIAVAQLKRKIEKKQIIKERDMNKQMQKDIKKFM